MATTPRDGAFRHAEGAQPLQGTRPGAAELPSSSDVSRRDPTRCPHCAAPHPTSYSHCPLTGKPLQTGPALVGRVIAGRYQVSGILGEGGMGAVYIAEHLLLGRKVALKRLHPELAGDEKAVARFQREARAAAATGHEHIVEVLDLGYAEDGAPYLVMEYLRGMALAQALKQEGRLPLMRTVNIVGQVLAALAAVHGREIVHRDLKPDNVFLTRRGGVLDYVKVLDFGISKMKQEDGEPIDLTRTGVTMGTPFYMSPEQARGVRKLDHRVDLYAVAVITYECLTGRLPLMGDNYHALLQQILRVDPLPPSAMTPTLPPELDAVLLKGLAKDPAQRFQSAAEMSAALARFGAPATALGTRATQPTLAPPRDPAVDPRAATEAKGPEGSAGDPDRRSGTVRPVVTQSLAGSTRPGVPSGGPSVPVGSQLSTSRATALPSPSAGSRQSLPPVSQSARPQTASGEWREQDGMRPDPTPSRPGTPTFVSPAGVFRGPTPSTGLSRVGSRTSSPEVRAAPPTGARYFFAASEDWQSPLRAVPRPRGSATSVPAASDERTVSAAPPLARGGTVDSSQPLAGDPPGHARASVALERHPPELTREPGRMDAASAPCVKGSLVAALLDHLTDELGAVSLELALGTLEPAMRRKLEGVILPMAWLPLALFDAVLAAADRDAKTMTRAVSAGRATAERELSTTHRMFLQTANPTSVLERLPHLHRVYFSRGEARVGPATGPAGSPGIRVEVEGPTAESAALVAWLSGFWQRTLELAGARDVKVAAVTARGRGDESSGATLHWR